MCILIFACALFTFILHALIFSDIFYGEHLRYFIGEKKHSREEYRMLEVVGVSTGRWRAVSGFSFISCGDTFCRMPKTENK